MRTIEQVESDLDATDAQPDSWAIELAIGVALVLAALFVLCPFFH